MSNIATTIEQSKHLIELGLPKETADMSYSEEYFGKDKDGNDEWYWKLNACKFVDVEGIIPAWSLSALLEVIPNNDYWDIYLYQAQEGKWQSEWNDCEISKGESKCFIADTPIGAAYEMVCWLLEQGLVEKGEQDGRD